MPIVKISEQAIKQVEEESVDFLTQEVAIKYQKVLSTGADALDAKSQLAFALKALKDKCGKNSQLFGAAIEKAGLSLLQKDERAALLKYANLTRDERGILLNCLKATGILSFRYAQQLGMFGDEKSLSQNCESDPHANFFPETVESDVKSPVTAESTPRNDEKSSPKELTVKESSPIYGRPRAEEVNAIINSFDSSSGRSNLRVALGAVHKNGWNLVLQSLDLGILTPNGYLMHNRSPIGRCLFNLISMSVNESKELNELLNAYDISTSIGCAKAERELMPFLRDHAESLKKTPNLFMKLWKEKIRKEWEIKQAEEKKIKIQQKFMISGAEEVMVCGMKIFPPEDLYAQYDFNDLREAWLFFQDLESASQPSITKTSRQGRAITYRFIQAKLYKKAEKSGSEEHRNFAAALAVFIRALDLGPEDKLETQIPSSWHDQVARLIK